MQKKHRSPRVGLMAATGVLATVAFLLAGAPTVLTQQQPIPGITPFQRDLTKELANKMKGTHVVAAVGDVLMQEPMGKMIDPRSKNSAMPTPPSATKNIT